MITNKLSEGDLETIERKVNNTIHELVFALHHVEDDEVAEALDALDTAAMTIHDVKQIVGQAEDV